MYILKNQDKPVAMFSSYDTMFGQEYRMDKTYARLPYGFSDLNDWMENRKASKHNAHLAKLMADCGCNTVEGFIRLTHAASMNDTLEIERFAPVFDFNLALLPYVMQDEFSEIDTVLSRYAPVIGNDFTQTGHSMLTSSIRADLINLKGFEFSYRGDEKFTEKRIKALEMIINRQIEGILKKEPLLTHEVFAMKNGKIQDKLNRVFEAE